jgi:hypothetical protein
MARANDARLIVMSVVPEPPSGRSNAGYAVPVDLDELGNTVERECQAMPDAAAVDTVPVSLRLVGEDVRCPRPHGTSPPYPTAN